MNNILFVLQKGVRFLLFSLLAPSCMLPSVHLHVHIVVFGTAVPTTLYFYVSYLK